MTDSEMNVSDEFRTTRLVIQMVKKCNQVRDLSTISRPPYRHQVDPELRKVAQACHAKSSDSEFFIFGIQT